MAENRNPSRTQAFIDDALRRFSSLDSREAQDLHAWAYLRGMRRLGDDDLCRRLGISVPHVESAPGDVDLADAEHYMYARFLGASTGDPAIRALVMGYEIVKVVRFGMGREKDLRTDQRFPVLPPSQDSVRWGLKGAEAGLKEYRDAHNGQSGRMGSAIEANRDFANGQYQQAYSPKQVYSPKH